ncbi:MULTISPECIES: urease accessory protein UreD [Bacillus]|uniref:Urease accessory protein UreD n=1 Tax=Bacillus mycoides TaxID=1405 RepID=A0A3D9VE18_BACMY|nr:MULTISPECIES: urease accessory protein UreD [Bacillus]RBP30580.1 urease accessory protein [Bacillus sp. DB-2]REF38963.1 urease accessory protein [Bacillus mycoides]
MKAPTGVLNIDVMEKRHKTVPIKVYHKDALKVTQPIYLDDYGRAYYYIMNSGGGYLKGDFYSININVHEDAKTYITSQSATKVYKTPNSYALQELNVYIGENAVMEYLPDPLIMYKDAAYKQKTNIYMQNNSTLILCDSVTPGWSPNMEKFTYQYFDSLTKVYMENKLVVYDHLLLNPFKESLDQMGILNQYSHYGTFMVINENITNDLIVALKTSLSNTNNMKIGISSMPCKGFVIRILSHNTEDMESIFFQCHRFVRENCLHEKLTSYRKY